MKEIKAFIHRNRVADVVRILGAAGFRNLSVIDVKGMLKARWLSASSFHICMAF